MENHYASPVILGKINILPAEDLLVPMSLATSIDVQTAGHNIQDEIDWSKQDSDFNHVWE